MIIARSIAQNTPEWDEIRRGIPTASNFAMIATSKGEPSKSREKYMYQLAAERISGIKEESYKNAHMARGLAMEAQARAFYELTTGNKVDVIGFCHRDRDKLFGCSPDGLVDKDGLVEIKCPSSAIHVKYLLENKLPTEYIQQIQGQLFITGRKWCDFFSFYPGLPPLLIRIYQNDVFAERIEEVLKTFCKELDVVSKKIEDL